MRREEVEGRGGEEEISWQTASGNEPWPPSF
jgi:hypothetical protein